MYEWDERKRQSNLGKHGIDFADMDHFDWENALIAEDLDGEYDENRLVAISEMNGRLCFVCYTRRGQSIRIISLRRATRDEMKEYYDGI